MFLFILFCIFAEDEINPKIDVHLKIHQKKDLKELLWNYTKIIIGGLFLLGCLLGITLLIISYFGMCWLKWIPQK